MEQDCLADGCPEKAVQELYCEKHFKMLKDFMGSTLEEEAKDTLSQWQPHSPGEPLQLNSPEPEDPGT